MSSSNQKHSKQIKPLLSLSAAKVQVLGNDPEAANVVKLAGNLLVPSVVKSRATRG